MSYIKSYTKYIKSQSEEVKNIHSVFIASLLTGVFAVVYLYVVRGIAPPTPSINITKEYTYTSQDIQNQEAILDPANPNANISSSKNIGDKQNINSQKQIESNTLNPFTVIGEIIRKVLDSISQIKNSLGESSYKVER